MWLCHTVPDTVWFCPSAFPQSPPPNQHQGYFLQLLPVGGSNSGNPAPIGTKSGKYCRNIYITEHHKWQIRNYFIWNACYFLDIHWEGGFLAGKGRWLQILYWNKAIRLFTSRIHSSSTPLPCACLRTVWASSSVPSKACLSIGSIRLLIFLKYASVKIIWDSSPWKNS